MMHSAGWRPGSPARKRTPALKATAKQICDTNLRKQTDIKQENALWTNMLPHIGLLYFVVLYGVAYHRSKRIFHAVFFIAKVLQ